MCDCIETMNANLAEHNVMIVHNLIGPPEATISVIKRDAKKRDKIPYLMATYCPFCGVKYVRESEKGEA
jgi:hypothetical protein